MKRISQRLSQCLLLLLVGALPQVFAADYYVSASTGLDTNNGLTPASAFQSIDKVNALALQPGDRVLFKAGDSWTGMLWPKGSGTLVSPITISSYDSGDKPIIDGNGFQAALLIFNDDAYEISGLALTNQASHLDGGGNDKLLSGFGGAENDNGSGRDVRFGVKIVANTRSLAYFRIGELDIYDVYPTPINTAFQHRGYGIKFESQSDVGANEIYIISDVEMDSLSVSTTGHYGVWARPLGLDGVDLHKHFDFVLRNSTFQNTGGAGFVPAKVENLLVENNRFDGTGSSIDPRMWKRGSGLWPFDSKDVIIQHNTVMNAQGPLDSYGIHIDYNNENVVVQYNFSYNNEGGFAQILGANINSGYRYNISVADGSRVDGVNGAIQNGRIFNVSNFCNIPAGCPSTGNFIYNNTVYVPDNISPEIFFKGGSGQTALYNNLIYVEPGNPGLSTQLAQNGVEYFIARNLFYPQALFTLDAALTTDALFIEPELRMPGEPFAALYKLLPPSMAKYQGKLISGSANTMAYSLNNGGQDFFGNPISDIQMPHIGAYNGNELLDAFQIPLLPLPWQGIFLLILVSMGVVVRPCK